MPSRAIRVIERALTLARPLPAIGAESMSRGSDRSPPSRIDALAESTTSPAVVIASTFMLVSVSVSTMSPLAPARMVPVSLTSMASVALPMEPAAFRYTSRATILLVSVWTPSRMLPLSETKVTLPPCE